MSRTSNKPAPAFSDSLGKTFRRRRLELKLTLDAVATETRIQKRFLKAIEKTDYSELPHTVNSLGFVRRYSRLLGLNSKSAASKYLAQRGTLPTPSRKSASVSLRAPLIGSRLIIRLVLAALALVVLSYIGWQLLILTSPPELALNSPTANQALSTSSITVSGNTTPGADVRINGQIVYVADDGSFSLKLDLAEGVNTIEAVASNSHNRTTTLERTVVVRMSAR